VNSNSPVVSLPHRERCIQGLRVESSRANGQPHFDDESSGSTFRHWYDFARDLLVLHVVHEQLASVGARLLFSSSAARMVNDDQPSSSAGAIH